MKVELRPHIGETRSGRAVEFAQWFLYAEDHHVGIVSHDPAIPMMLFANQPNDVLRELVRKCEKITGRKVIPPCDIYEPPEIDNSAAEDDDDDTEENTE